MSNFISTLQAALERILAVSPLTAFELLLGLAVLTALLVLFKPLLLGMARVLLFFMKSRSGKDKEMRLARSQMRQTNIVNNMINSIDSSPSHAAEIRALASRS